MLTQTSHRSALMFYIGKKIYFTVLKLYLTFFIIRDRTLILPMQSFINHDQFMKLFSFQEKLDAKYLQY